MNGDSLVNNYFIKLLHFHLEWLGLNEWTFFTSIKLNKLISSKNIKQNDNAINNFLCHNFIKKILFNFFPR